MLISKNTLGSAAVTPASGKTNFFMNEDGIPSIKDSAGAVSTLLTEGEAGDSFQPLNANLTGLSALTPAADQSTYYNGATWATYSLTAAGRALSAVAGTANTFPYFSAANVVTLGSVGATGLASLAAATPAAGRTAIGAPDATAVVDLTTNQSVGGNKTFPGNTTFGVSTSGSVVRAFVGNDGSYVQLYKTSGNSGTERPTIRLSDATAGVDAYMRNLGVSVQIYATFAGVGDRGFSMESNTLRPTVDNVMSSATAAVRWTQLFAANATIGTSDARLKTDPRQLRDAEFKAASAIARLPAVWRWLNRVHGDETCEPEGREARKHFGPTVQAAIAVMEAHGLDPFAYSFICYDEWEALPEQWHEWEAQEAVLDDDGNEIEPAVEAGRELVQEAREAGDRYSFRKEELLCFIVRALAQEIDGLSERVAALEAARTA